MSSRFKSKSGKLATFLISVLLSQTSAPNSARSAITDTPDPPRPEFPDFLSPLPQLDQDATPLYVEIFALFGAWKDAKKELVDFPMAEVTRLMIEAAHCKNWSMEKIRILRRFATRDWHPHELGRSFVAAAVLAAQGDPARLDLQGLEALAVLGWRMFTGQFREGDQLGMELMGNSILEDACEKLKDFYAAKGETELAERVGAYLSKMDAYRVEVLRKRIEAEPNCPEGG